MHGIGAGDGAVDAVRRLTPAQKRVKNWLDWLLVRDEEEELPAATRSDLAALTAQVAELTVEVRALRADRDRASAR